MKKMILSLMLLVNMVSMSWTITEGKDEFGDNNGQKRATQNMGGYRDGIFRLQKDGKALEFYIALRDYIGDVDNNKVKFKVDDNNPISLSITSDSQDGTALWIANTNQKSKFDALINQMKQGKILKISINGHFYDFTRKVDLKGFSEALEIVK